MTLPAERSAGRRGLDLNLPALDAVLSDIADAGVDARNVLGDLVGCAPWPNEVLERLRAEEIPTVMASCTPFPRVECRVVEATRSDDSASFGCVVSERLWRSRTRAP